jgi:hypothetical protein
MPIRSYLDGHRFDPETVRLMGIAFEMALVALQRTDGVVNPTREAIAQKIIVLARAGERDPERLCEGAERDATSDPGANHRLQSSSASRFTAGAAGFLNLSQSLVRPER